MIQEFIDAFIPKQATLFTEVAPPKYLDVVRAVIEAINPEKEYDGPDFERIHQIDDGDYQGTLLFLIAAVDYQPSDYWYVKVYYGSCSGCDTLQGIGGYRDDPPTPEAAKEYQTLALHVVQGLKKLGDEPL